MPTKTIYRPQTETEKKDFTDIGPYKKKDPKTNFLTELSIERAKKTKEKIPFFKKAAMDDFDEHYKEEVKRSIKRNGYVKFDEIKKVKMDWKKYSSPAKIKLVEVHDVRDANMCKIHNREVLVKTFRYKYEGYGREGDYQISVMEDEWEALKRARALYDNIEYKEVSGAEKISERYKK